MKSQKKTLIDVTRKKIHPYHLALATMAAVALYTGVSASIHARGVIPLSTRIPDEKLVTQLQYFPEVQAIGQDQDFVQPQINPDAELLNLLRSSSDQDADNDQWKVVRMRVTAYCTCPHCCGKYSKYRRTADMHKVRRGDVFVAADKRHSFGTEMIIPGYNQERPVEVKDRGRLIKGNRLDVFFNSHKVAKKWGTRYLDVLVKAEE